MNTYFSTFIPGLGDVVKEQLSKDSNNLYADLLLDGIIVYRSDSSIQEIKRLRYLNNSFLFLKKFDLPSTKNPLEFMVQQVLKDNLTSIPLSGNTFRIMFYLANEPVSIPKILLGRLEEKIINQYKLKVDRTNPDQEFWFLYRAEGCGLFGLRLTKHPDWKKVLLKGQLRPELASLMSIISEPVPNDIVLDPFAGSGAITSERKLFPHKKVLSGDIKPLNRGIQKIDALNMTAVINSNSIDKIITDPPWGISVGKELNLYDFYKKMLEEFVRILKSNGLAIILIGKKEIFEEVLNNNQKLNLASKYNILVSGKKAAIYKLIRL